MISSPGLQSTRNQLWLSITKISGGHFCFIGSRNNRLPSSFWLSLHYALPRWNPPKKSNKAKKLSAQHSVMSWGFQECLLFSILSGWNVQSTPLHKVELIRWHICIPYCNELSKPSIYLRCWTLLLLGEVPHNVIWCCGNSIGIWHDSILYKSKHLSFANIYWSALMSIAYRSSATQNLREAYADPCQCTDGWYEFASSKLYYSRRRGKF